MIFDGFFGIDWSGDKSKFQKGIKVAYLDKKNINPVIIFPPNKNKYWNRSSLIEYLQDLNSNKSYLIGFDFAFAYPFEDYKNYFVDLDSRYTSRYWLRAAVLHWKAQDIYSHHFNSTASRQSLLKPSTTIPYYRKFNTSLYQPRLPALKIAGFDEIGYQCIDGVDARVLDGAE